MDSLVASASKNTTLHKAELRMAFELMLDAIKENLSAGNIVELKGIGNIVFSCSGAWTETPEEQKAVEHKIGVSFFPSQEVHAAVATAKTSWTKDGEATSLPLPTHRAALRAAIRNRHRRLRANGNEGIAIPVLSSFAGLGKNWNTHRQSSG